MPTLAFAIEAHQAKDGALQFTMAADQVKQAAAGATKATGNLEQSTKSVGATMSSVRGMVVGLDSAYVGLEAVKSTFRGLAAEQLAMSQINAGLKSTGGISGQTAESIRALSKEMMALTTYSDDAALSAQSILLTFGHISGDVFPATVRAAADVAARFGRDLPDTMLALGKAIDSPTEGMANLTRIGIRFTQSQEAVIKMLDSTGNRMEAQRYMLKVLETQFGGSAAAARDTLGGALTGLKNDFEDLSKSIVEHAGPTLKGWLVTASDVTKVLSGNTEYLRGNKNEAILLATAIEQITKAYLAFKAAQISANIGGMAIEFAGAGKSFAGMSALKALGTKSLVGAGLLLDAVLIGKNIKLMEEWYIAAKDVEDTKIRLAQVEANLSENLRRGVAAQEAQNAAELKARKQYIDLLVANDVDWHNWIKNKTGDFSNINGLDSLALQFANFDARVKGAGDSLEKTNLLAKDFNDFITTHERAIEAIPGGKEMMIALHFKIGTIQQAAFKEADKSIQKHFEDLDLEIKYQGLPPEEYEKAKKLLEFTREINKVYGEKSAESLSRITQYEQKLNTLIATSPELAHKRAEAAAQMYEQMQDYGEGYYQAQKKLLEMQKQEYAVYVQDKVLLEKWYQNQLQKLDEERHPIKKYYGELKRDIYDDSGRYVEEKFVQAAQRIESAWSDAFYSMIAEGGSFKDAMTGLVQDVGRAFGRMAADMMARMVMLQTMQAVGGAAGFNWTGSILSSFAGAGMGAAFGGFGGGGGNTSTGGGGYVGGQPDSSGFGITDPWGGSLRGGAHANGNIFWRGDVVPFASGGIFDKPTYFPMSGGKTGLMGENGPEAVMPLSRGSDGRLGVRADQPAITSNTHLKIVNVDDPSRIADIMSSSTGERVIINAIRRNKGVLKGLM